MLNINFLTRIVQWAVNEENWKGRERIANVPLWNQGTWGEGHVVHGETIVLDPARPTYVPVKCDSGCCLAGNTTLLNGDVFIVPDYQAPSPDDDYAIEVTQVLTRDTREVAQISERARDLLGLSRDEADWLFGGSNDIHQVVGFADAIAENNGFPRLDLTDADAIRASDYYARARESLFDA